jgi:hypothetical protein
MTESFRKTASNSVLRGHELFGKWKEGDANRAGVYQSAEGGTRKT